MRWLGTVTPLSPCFQETLNADLGTSLPAADWRGWEKELSGLTPSFLPFLPFLCGLPARGEHVLLAAVCFALREAGTAPAGRGLLSSSAACQWLCRSDSTVGYLQARLAGRSKLHFVLLTSSGRLPILLPRSSVYLLINSETSETSEKGLLTNSLKLPNCMVLRLLRMEESRVSCVSSFSLNSAHSTSGSTLLPRRPLCLGPALT